MITLNIYLSEDSLTIIKLGEHNECSFTIVNFCRVRIK